MTVDPSPEVAFSLPSEAFTADLSVLLSRTLRRDWLACPQSTELQTPGPRPRGLRGFEGEPEMCVFLGHCCRCQWAEGPRVETHCLMLVSSEMLHFGRAGARPGLRLRKTGQQKLRPSGLLHEAAFSWCRFLL